jgi:protein phosphatase
MAITISIHAVCERGLVRDDNQDFVIAGSLDSDDEPFSSALGDVSALIALEVDDGDRGPLVIVCDGMGGGEHGRVASTAAAETVWKEMRNEVAPNDRLVLARQLRRAVRAANLAVRAHARRLKSRAMGTTVAAAALANNVAILALVGDCRAYVCRGSRLAQVTRDQSVVSALVSAGTLTREQARASERRHMVLQALGPEEDVVVSLSVAEMRRGDRLLLSSDGVHDVLDDQLIGMALAENPDDEVAALVRLAELIQAAGAPDNYSALLMRVDGDGINEPLESGELPQFTELDPAEEGEGALVTTSAVARRLAGRAGIQATVTDPRIPVTGTHSIVTADFDEPVTGRTKALEDTRGPAQRALAERSKIPWFWWLVAVAGVAAALWYILVT